MVARWHDVEMDEWVDGDLTEEFEQRLDALLVELCPGWTAPEFPEEPSSSRDYLAYERINVKRSRLASLLREQPKVAIANADRVLDAIVCDEDVSSNRQLIEPMVAAVGRRRVQEHLISVIESGSFPRRVCAVRAWYWSQAMLIYHSARALRDRHPTAASKATDDEVADLRAWYRAACLTAFVDCDHKLTRKWLAQGFILDPSFYPSNLHGKVAQARAIAESEPAWFKDLLTKTDDGTNLAAIVFDDH
jgi:hypothetical protein